MEGPPARSLNVDPARSLDVDDLEPFARGCAVLGTGGGGDVEIPLLQARAAVQEHGPVPVHGFDDLPDDALVLPVAGWGAPTVGIEKLGSGKEGDTLRRAAEERVGQPVDVLMAGEIGGGNGVLPVAWAASMGLPLLDADGMGRAFPEGPQVAMYVAGVPAAPAFFADEFGNVVTAEPASGAWYERIARTLTIGFGGSVAGADHLMTVAVARTSTVRGSVSLALRLGEALAADGLEGLRRVGRAIPLLAGKVVDVERRTTGGFARGVVDVEGTGTDTGRSIRVHVQNENLLVTEGERVLASVPDLIALVDESTADAIPTERVRFGQRVLAVALPCDPIWRTPRGLEVAGPTHFGFEHSYVPVEDLHRG